MYLSLHSNFTTILEVDKAVVIILIQHTKKLRLRDIESSRAHRQKVRNVQTPVHLGMSISSLLWKVGLGLVFLVIRTLGMAKNEAWE